MAGPQPSAVVAAMSTIVGVALTGFVVSVLGAAGGAGANLPIPVINGTAAPQADEVGLPPAIELPRADRDRDGDRKDENPVDPKGPPESTPGTGPEVVPPPAAEEIGGPGDPGTPPGGTTPPTGGEGAPGAENPPPTDPGAGAPGGPSTPGKGNQGNGTPGNGNPGNGNPGNGNPGNGNPGKGHGTQGTVPGNGQGAPGD